MVILSDIDGLYTANPQIDPAATLIPRRGSRRPRHPGCGRGARCPAWGSGGMITKIKAARVLMAAGIPMVICQGRRADCIVQAAAGEAVGTLFTAPDRPTRSRPRSCGSRSGDSVHGTVVVDERGPRCSGDARQVAPFRGHSLRGGRLRVG